MLVKVLDGVSMTFTFVGGLNWGLEVFNQNLVTRLADLVKIPVLEKVVYGAVGLSAVYLGGKWLLKKLKVI